MTTRHDLPDLGAVVRAQLALVAARPRRALLILLGLALVQIVLAAVAGIVFGVRIEIGGGEREATTVLFARIADLRLAGMPVDEGLATAMGTAIALAAIGLFWPFRVWRDEPPSRRGYHRAMPVDRRTHDLVRVAAGAVWLEAIAVLLMATAVGAAAAAGHATLLADLPATFWLAAFTTPLLAYLLVSVAALRTEHPAAWVWGTAGAGLFLWTLAESLRLAPLVAVLSALVTGRLGLGAAAVPALAPLAAAGVPQHGHWAAATLLWLAGAAATVWIAASARSKDL